jgi:hypothetical protein
MIHARLLRFGPDPSDGPEGVNAMAVGCTMPLPRKVYFGPAGNSAITRSSDFCQSIIRNPNTRSSFPQSRLEFAGRCAGVGYSAVEIGCTVANFNRGLRRWSVSTAAEANPYQVVSPEPAA